MDKGLFFRKVESAGRRLLPRAVKYLLLLLTLTAICVSALFVAGFGGSSVQQRIQKNIRLSLKQLETEGTYPNIFNLNDNSDRLDNFTEAVILMQCLSMDTVSNADSVFANRQFRSADGKIASLRQMAYGAKSNDRYVRYWIGIRAIVRPLLIFYTYPEIRNLMSCVMLGLMFLAALTIWKYKGGWMAAAFVVTGLTMNMAVLSSCLQFIPCFLVAFMAIIALPAVRKRQTLITFPMFFFIIGVATQFLDFYTAPPVTYCLPMIFLLTMETGKGVGYRIRLTAICLLTWGMGYGLMWIMKLALSSLALKNNEFAQAFGSFTKWTGVSGGEQYDRFTVPVVFRSVFNLVFSKRNLFMLFGFLIGFGVYACKGAMEGKSFHIPDVLVFLPTLLPLIWITLARRATGNHFWFQYRQMAGMVFSLTAFVASAVLVWAGEKNLCDDLLAQTVDYRNPERTEKLLSVYDRVNWLEQKLFPNKRNAREPHRLYMENQLQQVKEAKRVVGKAKFYLDMGVNRQPTLEALSELLRIGAEINEEMENFLDKQDEPEVRNMQDLVKQRIAEQKLAVEKLVKERN